ncbi:MAG: 2Fe-2S iron-sulfur cluster-binding protein [Planctomycetota bacterium]|nr:2Fe-2S iron-sulfur cluster-binding protein [Planctomycetota bacterium]
MSDHAPANRKVKTVIDGREIEVARDTWALDAAAKLKIRIPTLCHHAALTPYGACRLCVVEVTKGKSTWLTTACDLPIREGLSICTNSPAVLAARRMTLELLWAQAPASEEIQALAREMGIAKPRFAARGDGENRCILCGLCVRACEQLGAGGAIGFTRRGVERTVDSPFGGQATLCIGCGSCLAVCPTGHIRGIDRAGQRRMSTWHTEMEMAACESCGALFAPLRQLEHLRPRLAEHIPIVKVCPACRRAKAAKETTLPARPGAALIRNTRK